MKNALIKTYKINIQISKTLNNIIRRRRSSSNRKKKYLTLFIWKLANKKRFSENKSWWLIHQLTILTIFLALYAFIWNTFCIIEKFTSHSVFTDSSETISRSRLTVFCITRSMLRWWNIAFHNQSILNIF